MKKTIDSICKLMAIVVLLMTCSNLIVYSQQIIPLERFDFSQEGSPEDSYEIVTSTVRDDQVIFTVGIADLTVDGQRFTVPWMTKSNLSGEIIQSEPILQSVETVEGMFLNNDGNLIIYGDGSPEYIIEVSQDLEVLQFNIDASYMSSLIQRTDNTYIGVHIDRLVVYNEDLSFNKEIFIPETVGPGGATYHEIIQKGENYILTGYFSGGQLYDNFPDISSTGGLDFIILEVNEEGEVLWANSLEGDRDETFFDDLEIGLKDRIIETSDDSYLITLTSRSTEGDFEGGLSSVGSWVFRLDQGGEVIWRRSIGQPISDIKQVNNSEILFTTRADRFGASLVECDTCVSNIAWLGVLDFATGELSRQSYLDAERDEYFTAFEVVEDGIILYGITESYEGEGIFYDDFFASDTDDAIVCFFPVSTSFSEPIDSDDDGFNSDVDCDDTNSSVYPGAIEICDSLDNNCDGEIDEDLVFQEYYEDQDGDGFGNDNTLVELCMGVVGMVLQGGDCNDGHPSIYPGAPEIPDNGVDEDCDGEDSVSELGDNDNDGYDSSVDCDDTDPEINPGAIEICDEIDNDCDGEVDEGLTFVVYYVDSDGDGYGDNNTEEERCMAGLGLVLVGGDCNDENPAIYPGAIDIPDNGIDEDCDGEDASEGPCDHPDYEGLVAFYNSTGGENWSNNSGWVDGVLNVDCSVCDWYGVGCTNGRVTSLLLENNNLIGQLSNSIASLELLNLLNLSGNDLSGPLPEQLFDLTRLNFLLLHSNNFVGGLPDAISNLSDLKYLTLQNNEFSGSLPTSIETLINLEEVYLQNNFFTGPIPTDFSNLSKLKIFYASLNNLEGSIPSSLGNLNLEQLYLEFNNLSGCIPVSFMSYCDKEINIQNDLLPWSGDMDRFCDGEDQIGATCLSNNQIGIIDEDCNCKVATSVEGVDFNDVKIFPNPTTDHIVLESTVIVDYELVTTLGEFVKSGTCDGETTININEQSSGLYYLIVDHKRIYKVIKL